MTTNAVVCAKTFCFSLSLLALSQPRSDQKLMGLIRDVFCLETYEYTSTMIKACHEIPAAHLCRRAATIEEMDVDFPHFGLCARASTCFKPIHEHQPAFFIAPGLLSSMPLNRTPQTTRGTTDYIYTVAYDVRGARRSAART